MLKVFVWKYAGKIYKKQNVKNIQQVPSVCTQWAGLGFAFGIQHILPNNEHVHCSILDWQIMHWDKSNRNINTVYLLSLNVFFRIIT